MNRRRRSAFTVMEVVVGLTVAALMMLVTRAVVEAVGDGMRRTATAAVVLDRDANADLLLRTLLGSALAFDSDSAAFVGNRRIAAFRSWCPTSGGWRERCSVAVVVELASQQRALALYLGADGERIALRRGFEAASLIYLSSAANGGRWVDEWAESRLPLAIGVVIDHDTSLLRVGIP